MKSSFCLKRLPFSVFLIFVVALVAKAAPAKFDPKKGSHIVLLGNTFADRMRHYGYFETLLQKSYPDRQLTLRNMGWSADEVGLQPRPLNFPGFRMSTPPPIEKKQVGFETYKHESAPINMPVALNYVGLNQDLTEQKADIIFLCFGMNEAFKGRAGLPQFQKDLETFTKNLLSNNYNGSSAPQLILVSPIAHENLGGYFPNPDEHNQNLRLYTDAMRQFALAKNMLFIDLFTSTIARGANGAPITINGIHLNDLGYRETAKWMGQQLGFPGKPASFNFASANADKLQKVVKMKDAHFFYRWRAVNGEYIYGRRREPFGIIAFPPELRKLNRMAAALDSVIWQLGKSSGVEAYKKAIEIVDERGKPTDKSMIPEIEMKGRQAEQLGLHDHGHHTPKVWPATTESFTVPEGYEINLFASEKDFPIEKPVAMSFDEKGRLWVATMPTYPQYYPGIPVHDRIVILEDTDNDGKADKHTVFADDLYLPLGFEFSNGGVIVSQEPDLVFLKDTDGDDKADVREVILTGFGSEDSHHATHAFTHGPDGALYINEGIFLNSQVETPYGPVRSYSGATYRYEPRTGKLQHYISYPYFNPWGNVFDKWGMHLIGDASDGSNYFAPPLTGRVEYPNKHPRTNMFTTTRVRPTAGIEIVSSRQFPDEVQGNFLVNNNIGFQGTKQHNILVEGSGISSKEVESILQSSDPNFRPIDIKFGPDGALYIVDWYNPLISHGENPPRDPLRDKAHGRVWRITYKNKPVLKKVDLSVLTIPELLGTLKEYEDRLRYRARTKIREQVPEKVLPELKKWVDNLDKKDANYELYLLEALWLYQDFDVVNPELLEQLLVAKDYRARTAATRVVPYWQDRLKDPLALLEKRVHDESPRVRLEAVVGLSHLPSQRAIEIVANAFDYPTDYYLDYAINETVWHMKKEWLPVLQQNPQFLSNKPVALNYLLSRCTSDELLRMPQSKHVLVALLGRKDVSEQVKKETLTNLAGEAKETPVSFLAGLVGDKARIGSDESLVELLLNQDPAALLASRDALVKLTESSQPNRVQSIGYGALLKADGSDGKVWEKASQTQVSLVNYLDGITLLKNRGVAEQVYQNIKKLTNEVPASWKKGTKKEEQGVASPFHPVYSKAYRILVSQASSATEKSELLKSYTGYLKRTPSAQLNSPVYKEALVLGKELAGKLPEAEAKKYLAELEALGAVELTLKAVPAKMIFDKELLTVPAGRRVSLAFENPDLMPHNVVITKPGAEEKVGTAADAMASLKDGFEKNFVPSIPEVLFATPLVNGGKSFVLDFQAPSTPGDYPFICSFPGHWRVMKGVLRVVAGQ
jgi:glucose/arabinose dehydrogenase/azurin